MKSKDCKKRHSRAENYLQPAPVFNSWLRVKRAIYLRLLATQVGGDNDGALLFQGLLQVVLPWSHLKSSPETNIET